MPIGSHTSGPHRLRKESSMNVYTESKMVWNEIFAGRSDVERIEAKVLESVNILLKAAQKLTTYIHV